MPPPLDLSQQRLTITNAGYVGIASTQPQSRLDVNGDANVSGSLIVTSNLNVGGSISFDSLDVYNENPAIPWLASYATPASTILYITPTSVGIGTTQTTATLDIEGTLKASSVTTSTLTATTVNATTLTGNAAAVTGLAPSAKIDTTNATNITSGILLPSRVPQTIDHTLNIIGDLTVTPQAFPPTAMSGNTSVQSDGTYIVNSSFTDNGEQAYLAFNGSAVTAWTSRAEYNPSYITRVQPPLITTDSYTSTQYRGHYIQLRAPSFFYLSSYTLNSTAVSWAVFGSANSGLTWRLLDSQIDTQPATFTVNSQNAYNTYRLVITKVIASGATYDIASVNQFQLYGAISTPFRGVKLTNSQLTTGNLLITPDGSIGIGVTSPTASLHIGSTGGIRLESLAANRTQPLYIDTFGIVTTSASDSRLKANVAAIPYGLAHVKQLNPVRFQWATVSHGDEPDIGLIAQEVQPVIPEAVTMNAGGKYNLDYAKLVPVLISAVKELAAEVAALRTTGIQTPVPSQVVSTTAMRRLDELNSDIELAFKLIHDMQQKK
jgi:Chaperone of endosialidase